LGVTGVGAYLRIDSQWTSLLNSSGGRWSSDVVIGVGACTLFVSLLGCAGAARIKRSRCILSTYVFLLAAVLLVQAIATAVWIDVDSAFARTVNGQVNLTKFQSEVVKHLEDAAIAVYNHGGCTADPTRLPDPVTCTNPRAAWIASYVNDVCVPDGLDLASPGTQSLLADPTNLFAVGLALSSAGVDVPQVLSCVHRQRQGTGASALLPLPTGADPQLVWGYCVCERPLAEKLRSLARPAAITLAVVTGVEVVVFAFALFLVCCRRDGTARAGAAASRAGRHAGPSGGMGTYAQHSSPPKVVVHQRGTIHMV
jgi:hypothetical protein